MRGQRLSCIAAKKGNDESVKEMKTSPDSIYLPIPRRKKTKAKVGHGLDGSEMDSQPLYKCAAFRVGIRAFFVKCRRCLESLHTSCYKPTPGVREVVVQVVFKLQKRMASGLVLSTASELSCAVLPSEPAQVGYDQGTAANSLHYIYYLSMRRVIPLCYPLLFVCG